MKTHMAAAFLTVAAATALTGCTGNGTAGAPTPAVVQAGLCLDLDSALVTDAFASLGTAPGGDPWVPGTGSDAAGENCPALLWATAETPGGTVSSPTQVLFFHDGTYRGTATAESYAYTQVVGSTDDSVSVEYRWLGEQDANCCPSGGPAVVTYSWDGSRVVMEQPLPQEMLDSYK
ncbi:LppP/LprE family lipoprotein [Rhodococcus wratislaviensis]|uniref:LppP/LprE family lipoprotein n=1 Tax=Rhodococcus wratislaviensis TaxID=44752 RepID=UPI0035199E55